MQSRCRNSFLQFTRTLSLEPEPAAHHRLLIAKLEAFARGEIPNLMVFMPPGAAKSTYCTVLFPAWYANYHKAQKKNILSISYADELAESFGRRVRNIIGSQEYYDMTGISLAKDSSAADKWETNTGSGYKAAGVGKGITGFRADLGIIDDPVKGAEEAASETVKRKTIEWYENDFVTRLKPGAQKLLVMTRWVEDDLAGYLLDEMATGGEQWEILRLPFIAEANDPLGRPIGERLWKEWFTDEMEKQARRNERKFSALYQQRPAPLEGLMFKREHLRYYRELPKNLKYYMTSDYAVSLGAGDYTVFIVFAVDEHDNIYIVDIWRQQADSETWTEAMCDLILRYKPLMFGEEKGVILKAVNGLIVKRMREKRAYVYRYTMPSVNSKEARAQAIHGRCSMGMVFLPEHADWLSDFIHELLTFPGGKFDDTVDAFGLIGRMLDKLAKASEPEEEKKVKMLNEATLDEMWQVREENKNVRKRI